MSRVLLVDDDLFLRDMYSLKFTEAGHEVIAAESGPSALIQLEQDQQFDVIVLDMIMPGMQGPELITAIKARYPDMQAKCIVLSNQGQDEDITAATNAGAVGYIVKADTIPSQVVRKVMAFLE